jgi:hypothetical protein
LRRERQRARLGATFPQLFGDPVRDKSDVPRSPQIRTSGLKEIWEMLVCPWLHLFVDSRLRRGRQSARSGATVPSICSVTLAARSDRMHLGSHKGFHAPIYDQRSTRGTCLIRPSGRPVEKASRMVQRLCERGLRNRNDHQPRRATGNGPSSSITVLAFMISSTS